MARQRPKSLDGMDPSEKHAYLIQASKKYGFDPHHDFTDDEGNDTDRTMEDAVIEAMNKDYDVRDAMKYGRDSGSHHFKDIGDNISSLEDSINVNRAIVGYAKSTKDHKDLHYTDDFAGVNNALFNASRKNFGSSFNKSRSDVDDEQTDTAITPDESYEPSDEYKKQAGILADWEAGYGAGGSKSPYTKSNFQDMAFNPAEANPYKPTTNVDEFAQQYKNNYTSGVKDVFQFRPTIA